jgi:Fe-S-cluster-containing hydrogenase component 2
MPQTVYRQLAERLNAIPNGFPSTASGVELRLLAKIFTPEQAALAAHMRLTPEPAADIAARAGADAQATYRLLKQMARQGLISAVKGDGQLSFGLMPFVVGIYEFQLPRMDAELAALFEQYFQETQGRVIVRDAPSVHRVIPVQEAIPVGVEVFPYQQAIEIIEHAQAWGVRDCICRVQKRLIGAGCDHPVQNCMVFAPVAGAFDYSPVDRAITKAEALHILQQAEAAGLVHTTGNYRDSHSYICNCCTCSCGVLRGVAEFGILNAVAHSDFRAAVDAAACAACGDCLARCQFGALAIPDEHCMVDAVHCVGCGLCVSACPTGALHLTRRPAHDIALLPADLDEWMAQRAQARNLSLSDLPRQPN